MDKTTENIIQGKTATKVSRDENREKAAQTSSHEATEAKETKEKEKEVQGEIKNKNEGVGPKAMKDETITISRGLLESVQKELKTMKEKTDMLEKVADKRQLAQWYSRHQEKIPQQVKLKTFLIQNKSGEFEEKVILATQMVKDLGAFKIPGTNAWKEDQVIKIILDDGTSKEIQYGEFVQGYRTQTASVISKTIDEKDGTILLKVARNDNNKEYEIDIKFIN